MLPLRRTGSEPSSLSRNEPAVSRSEVRASGAYNANIFRRPLEELFSLPREAGKGGPRRTTVFRNHESWMFSEQPTRE